LFNTPEIKEMSYPNTTTLFNILLESYFEKNNPPNFFLILKKGIIERGICLLSCKAKWIRFFCRML